MKLKDLKKIEGSEIDFFYKGKYRPFILRAVQDTDTEICVNRECADGSFCEISYKGRIGDIRIDYNYPSKNDREEGFWTNKTNLVKLPNAT